MPRRRTSAHLRELGKAYAAELHLRSKLMRSCFLLTRVARDLIARDLEALAYIAEHHPEVFRHKRVRKA
jgi:hypothetical protein